MDLTSSWVLLIYFAATFLAQFFMDDGGDQGLVGSPAERVWGVPCQICNVAEVCTLIAACALLMALFVKACGCLQSDEMPEEQALLLQEDHLPEASDTKTQSVEAPWR